MAWEWQLLQMVVVLLASVALLQPEDAELECRGQAHQQSWRVQLQLAQVLVLARQLSEQVWLIQCQFS